MNRCAVSELISVESVAYQFYQLVDFGQLLRCLLLRINGTTEIALAFWAVLPFTLPRSIAVSTVQRRFLLLHNGPRHRGLVS